MRKKLKNLAALVDGAEIIGNADTFITDIVQDSRQAGRGSMFVCMEGAHVDGHTFIGDVAKKGAAAIITQRKGVKAPAGVAVLVVPNLDEALKVIVPAFFDYPGQQLRMIGITGTNGKTTTSYLVRAMLRQAGYKVGLIGTIQIMIGDKILPVHNTTPNVVDLQRTLHQMVEDGVQYAVMEVSSHALDQGRISGCEFDTAVFTNLTQDHLDYHKTMENYRDAKAKLFDMLGGPGLKPGKTAVVNIDDAAGAYMLEHAACEHITYAVESEEANLRAVEVRVRQTGASLAVQGSFGRIKLNLHITGMFNIYNVLGAVGAAVAENVPVNIIEQALENFMGVPGRFELVDCGQPFAVVVDYAH
ncbi:MAG: UDP-N-acetylmuramoyl-L-alanyl-D-glutamate--2,6-diaminopimelate ligase, partial [Schwartzia sp.]|nr:UDP-N-acetylmuramoyl-L-alanyl-D-glutamate--2,6-diaminopimelate ligase [Schwartzia sp. (in: firmicutes)]